MLGYYFPLKKVCNIFVIKTGWASLWAIFSQAKLVTLIASSINAQSSHKYFLNRSSFVQLH
jgi:hypothetical protein